MILQQEIWVAIKNFEGLYEISSLGRVKSLARTYKTGETYRLQFQPEVIMRLKEDKNGYYHIRLGKDGKKYDFRVHRLVAMAFLENPDELPVVMHLDNNVKNNVVSNLKWGSVKENTLSAHRDGLCVKTYYWLGNGNTHPSRKTVGMYDLDGNLLKTFFSHNEAVRQGYKSIFNAIHKGSIAYNHKWAYINNVEVNSSH